MSVQLRIDTNEYYTLEELEANIPQSINDNRVRELGAEIVLGSSPNRQAPEAYAEVMRILNPLEGRELRTQVVALMGLFAKTATKHFTITKDNFGSLFTVPSEKISEEWIDDCLKFIHDHWKLKISDGQRFELTIRDIPRHPEWKNYLAIIPREKMSIHFQPKRKTKYHEDDCADLLDFLNYCGDAIHTLELPKISLVDETLAQIIHLCPKIEVLVLNKTVGSTLCFPKLPLSLKRLTLDDSEFVDSSLNTQSLPNLQILTIENCKRLQMLSIGNFANLKKLNVGYCKNLIQISGFENTAKLEKLAIGLTPNLSSMPNFENCATLELLDLTGLPENFIFPESLENLKRLKSLKVRHCIDKITDLSFSDVLESFKIDKPVINDDFGEKLIRHFCFLLSKVNNLDILRKFKDEFSFHKKSKFYFSNRFFEMIDYHEKEKSEIISHFTKNYQNVEFAQSSLDFLEITGQGSAMEAIAFLYQQSRSSNETDSCDSSKYPRSEPCA